MLGARSKHPGESMSVIAMVQLILFLTPLRSVSRRMSTANGGEVAPENGSINTNAV